MNSMTSYQRAVMDMVLLATLAVAIFSAPAHAQAVAPADQWTFSIPRK